MSEGTSRKKVLVFMLLSYVQKNAYDTNFQVLLYTCNVLEYLKTETSENGTFRFSTNCTVCAATLLLVHSISLHVPSITYGRQQAVRV